MDTDTLDRYRGQTFEVGRLPGNGPRFYIVRWIGTRRAFVSRSVHTRRESLVTVDELDAGLTEGIIRNVTED